ncbi:MAG: twin-arginine translocase subunit TatB [Hyphomicrobiaceae bacterium]|nr:twin-arginine translocase subunit TatB [Hyphomicrobiaceae bacterium]
MFDIGGYELLIIGIVALVVVGPKELPTLLRTIGRVVGMVRQQAQEFRNQFDEAMRETELAELKKSVDDLKAEAQAGFRDVEDRVNAEVSDVKAAGDDIGRDLDKAGTKQAAKDNDFDWDDGAIEKSDPESAPQPEPAATPAAAVGNAGGPNATAAPKAVPPALSPTTAPQASPAADAPRTNTAGAAR